ADGRGVLCPVGDAHAMAQGMARCPDDAAVRADCTQRAYDYVRPEHDVTEMGRRYLALFARLPAARRAQLADTSIRVSNFARCTEKNVRTLRTLACAVNARCASAW